MTNQEILRDIEIKLEVIHNSYRDLDVQRARLEGKEVILSELKKALERSQ